MSNFKWDNLLWGTYQQQQQTFVEFLKPHPSAEVTFTQFFKGRQRIAWVWVFITLRTFVQAYDEPLSPFIYLTNWCRFTVAIAYFILWLAHRLNQDHLKSEYSAPDLKDDDDRIKTCCQPWKWGTLLYEWQLVVSLYVFIAFFFVELPLQMDAYAKAPS
jgi:hypothetical protein